MELGSRGPEFYRVFSSVPSDGVDLRGGKPGSQGDQETCPVCVALNVLVAGQPPSTIGSR